MQFSSRGQIQIASERSEPRAKELVSDKSLHFRQVLGRSVELSFAFRKGAVYSHSHLSCLRCDRCEKALQPLLNPDNVVAVWQAATYHQVRAVRVGWSDEQGDQCER